jgi:hypothetical protein
VTVTETGWIGIVAAARTLDRATALTARAATTAHGTPIKRARTRGAYPAAAPRRNHADESITGSDWIPSLHVYDDPESGWYCFGCRRGGTIYDLAGGVWGIQPRGDGMRALRSALQGLVDPDVRHS